MFLLLIVNETIKMESWKWMEFLFSIKLYNIVRFVISINETCFLMSKIWFISKTESRKI